MARTEQSKTAASTKSRGKGEGTVYQRQDGRWVARYPLPNYGGYKYRYASTERDAIKLLKKMHADHEAGRLVHTAGATVGSYLDAWLAGHEKHVAASTFASYRNSVENHLKPTLGRVKLDRLSPSLIERAYEEMARRGAGQPTVIAASKVLRKALADGVRKERIAVNHARAVTPPPAPQPRREALRPDAAMAFLDWLQTADPKMHPLCYVAFALGLRRGELLGLKWGDLDFGRRRLTVRHNAVRVGGEGVVVKERPKSAAGFRVLPLLPGVIAMLGEHRRLQDYRRRSQSEHWHDHDLVFASDTGAPRDPSNTSNRMRKLIEAAAEAGLKGVRLHGMRHTNASFLGLNGVSLKVAATMLGHSSVDVTADTYTHVFDEQTDAAAVDLEAYRKTAARSTKFGTVAMADAAD